MYSVKSIRRQNRVALHFEGMMEQEHSVLFGELKAAAEQVRGRNGEWDLTVDYSSTPVLPQERARNAGRIFEWCVENEVRKIACIISSMTQLMQVRRLSARSPQVECFDNTEDAEFWLGL